MPRIVSTEQIINEVAKAVDVSKTALEILRELIFNMEKYRCNGGLKKEVVLKAFQQIRPLLSEERQEDFDRVTAIASDVIDVIVFAANNAKHFKKMCMCCK